MLTGSYSVLQCEGLCLSKADGLWKNTGVLKAVAQILKHRWYFPSLQQIHALHKSSLRKSIMKGKKWDFILNLNKEEVILYKS